MGMSYHRAWNLVDTMNREFTEPLVQTAAGGKRGGGTEITETGEQILKRYREIEVKATQSVSREIAAFSKYIAKYRG